MWAAMGKIVVLNMEHTTKQEVPDSQTVEIVSLPQFATKVKTNFVLSNANTEFYCYFAESGACYIANYTGKPIPNETVLYGQAILVKA